MKGFPNQVANLEKLAEGLRCIERLNSERRNARDDGVLGEALVRAGVSGTGHTPVRVEVYLRAQRLKTSDRQSFRTTARGLRELYRLLGLIDQGAAAVSLTPAG